MKCCAIFLLKLWDINTPDIALVTLEPETIREDYGSRHNPLYYKRLTFGSKEFEGSFDVSQFIEIKGKIDFKKYYRAEMFSHIGLFDMWVDNEDRGPELKNLMLFEKDSRYNFLAIDQAAAFRSGAYETLKYDEFYPIEDNFLLQSTFFRGLKRFLKADKEWLKKEEEKYYLCISRCKDAFFEIAAQIPQEWGFTLELQTLVSGFLFNDKRNRQVFAEYLRLCR